MANIPRQANEEDPAYRVRQPVGPPPLDSQSEVEVAKQDEDMEEGDFLQPAEIRQTQPMTLQQMIGTWGNRQYRSDRFNSPEAIFSNPLDLLDATIGSGLDKAVGVHEARMKIIDPISNINPIAGVAAEMLVPAAADLASFGTAYPYTTAKRVATNLPEMQRLASKVNWKKTIDEVWEGTKRVWDDITGWSYQPKLATANGADLGQQAAKPLKMTGSGGDGYINPIRQPEVPQVVRQALGNAGIRDNGTFHYATYLKNRKSLKSSDRRGLAGLFMTDPMKGFTGKNMDQALTSYTNRIKADFMKVYTPEFLAKYDIDASQIQLHHINALLGSLPMYDGLRYMSPEWLKLTGTLLKKNVHAGHSLKNLRFLVGRSKDFRTPHGITHKYLDEVVGPDGEKFFNALIPHNGKSITRLEYMKLSNANRIKVANAWADKVLKGNEITDQAVGVFNAINADLLNLKPENIEDIMSSLGKLQANGLVKPELINGKWQIGQKEMRELLFDMDFTENIGQHFLLANPQGLRALRIALQSDNPVSAYKAVRETLPKQLSLFNDNKVKTLAKKSRRYNKKWDIPDDSPESPFTDPGTLGPEGKRDW